MSSFDLNAAQSFMKRITDRILEKGMGMGLGVQPGPRCGHMIGLRPISKEMVEYLTPETMVEKRKEAEHNQYSNSNFNFGCSHLFVLVCT